ncbi:MAG: ABC transporter ATP-binding protein [Desulfatiglandales bacterium]
MPVILHTEGLCRHFGGVLATNEVSIQIVECKLKSIIGPNGAGKTTLVNVITGRLPASSGKVLYKDREITNRPPHELIHLGICRTFQITSIFSGLSVFENIRISRQMRIGGSFKIFSSRKGLKQVNEEAWKILERIGLDDRASSPAKNLAHGDKCLLEVGMALAGDPKILFLDEPTAGMSPAETDHIARLIKSLSEQIAVVLIEHDMDVIMSISDEITVLHQGRIIAEGPPATIQGNDLVKEAYLGHG